MSDAYQKAGVNIHAGYAAVDRIQKHAKSTNRPGVLGNLGAFGGMFDLTAINVKDPILVSGTDGVGTKLMLAFETMQHDSIGIDAVAMCVNDIVAQGAEPLYFLDYIACGKLVPEKIETIVSGIAKGCRQAGAALIGGETAEMPDMYGDEEYDIAGFSVGVVEKSKCITGEHVENGDVLIGLASSGVHSNGFSLVRKVIRDAHLNLKESYQFDQTLGEELLEPTRIYVQSVRDLLQRYEVKGIAHITGGGLIENVPRMIPKGLCASINDLSWPIPSIFPFIQKHGHLSKKEMISTFNMGIGMVLAVSSDEVSGVMNHLEKSGEKVYHIGQVEKGEGFLMGGACF